MSGYHSAALNLIGSYVDDESDLDSADDSESSIPVVKCPGTNISDELNVEPSCNNEPVKSGGKETSVSGDEATLADPDVFVTQDEIPQVGMDCTIDVDSPDESICAQIELVESHTDENDRIDESTLIHPTNKKEVMSENNGEMVTTDSSELINFNIEGASEAQSDWILQKKMHGDSQITSQKHLTTEIQPTCKEVLCSIEDAIDSNSGSTVSVTSASKDRKATHDIEQLSSDQQVDIDRWQVVSEDQHHQYYSEKYGSDQHYHDVQQQQQPYDYNVDLQYQHQNSQRQYGMVDYHACSQAKQYSQQADPQQYPQQADPQQYPQQADPQQYPQQADPQQYPQQADPQQYSQLADPQQTDQQQYPQQADPQQHSQQADPQQYSQQADPQQYLQQADPQQADPQQYPQLADPQQADPQQYSQQADPQQYSQQADPQQYSQQADPQQADPQQYPQQADPQQYSQQADPQQYSQQADPQQYSQQADPQQYSQQADPQQYSQQADPQQYLQQADPQQADPQQYPQLADPQQADPQQYSQQADPQQYSQQADPQQYLQQADPQLYSQQADPQQYSQQADPQQYSQQVDPQQADPQQYSQQYSQQADPQQYSQQYSQQADPQQQPDSQQFTQLPDPQQTDPQPYLQQSSQEHYFHPQTNQQHYAQPDEQQYSQLPDQQPYFQHNPNYLQPDQQAYLNSEQQHDTPPVPQGEYSHVYTQQQSAFVSEHQDQYHHPYTQTYQHQYPDSSHQYDQSSSSIDNLNGQIVDSGYHSVQETVNDQSRQFYHYPGREGYVSFERGQRTYDNVEPSGPIEYRQGDYDHGNQQPCPPSHRGDPYPQPFPPYYRGQRRGGGRRVGDSRGHYSSHRDWSDHRPSHYERWGSSFDDGRESPGKVSPRPHYGSPVRDHPRDSSSVSGSPNARDRTSQLPALSDPRQRSGLRGSPQRNSKTLDVATDPRRRYRDTDGKCPDSEEKHYTKSAKYTKLSSTLVSRRPAMLKAGNVSKIAKVTPKGPQIIEPHFAASTSPKAKVSDGVEKPKPPVKLPEATTAKKALASFKIPKHKGVRVASEPATAKTTVKIPALDIVEKQKEEVASSESQESLIKCMPNITPPPDADTSSTTPQSSKVSPKKDVFSQKTIPETKSKSVKESKIEKTTNITPKEKTTKISPKKASSLPVSDLDASTLQTLTTIVQQTLKMAANKGMPVAKSIAAEMVHSSTTTSDVNSTILPKVQPSMSKSTEQGQVNSSIHTPQTTVSHRKKEGELSAKISAQEKLIPSSSISVPTPLEKPLVSTSSTPKLNEASNVSNQRKEPAHQISTVDNPLIGSLTQLLQLAAGINRTKEAKKSTTTHVSSVTDLQTAAISSAKQQQRLASAGVVLATFLSGSNSQMTSSTETNLSKGKLSTFVVPIMSTGADNAKTQENVSSSPVSLPSANTVQTTSNISSTPQTSCSVTGQKVSGQVCNSVVDKAVKSTSKQTCDISSEVEKRTDVHTKSMEATATMNLLKYFNADLMMKEYNLRQSKGAVGLDGSSPSKLKVKAGVKDHDYSLEKSHGSKRERSLESENSPKSKKTRLSRSPTSSNDKACSDRIPVSSISSEIQSSFPNGVLHEKRGRSKPFLRRKASVQRRKSQSHKRPKLDGISETMINVNKAEDLVCAFCHQRDGAMNLGFLYGPYSVSVADIDDPHRNKDVDNDITFNPPKELWVHEDCAVWAPGVCLVGGQLLGLQEAAADGDKMMCQACKRMGATLCCSAHRCKTAYHYPCAQETGCVLKEEQFLISCSKHKVTT